MVASMFTLDHRLTELRQIAAELRAERAAQAAARPGHGFVETLRSLVGTPFWATGPARA